MRYFIWVLAVMIFSPGQFAYAKSLSLREKIGQMLIVGFDGKALQPNSAIVKSIQEDNIGGVILFDYNHKTESFDKNIESPEQVKALNHSLQAAARYANRSFDSPNLPLLISVDYEGGQVNRLSHQYGFANTYSQEAVGKKTLAQANRIAKNMSDTLRKAEFNLNFSPVLDVNTNPNNPIIAKKERSFSSSPTKVSEYGFIYTSQYIGQGIQCAYKHFPGHGSSTGDSHLEFVDVSETWESKELYPFHVLLNQSIRCGMVMTAHIVNKQLDDSGLPATLSYNILTNLLRNQIGFNGVIVTDDMQMKAISEQYTVEEAVTLTINAGADMIMFGNQLTDKPQSTKELVDLIEQKVLSGEISHERIDSAYRHIVQLKKSISIE